MDDIKARQQLVDKIKKSTNILVTVSNDPSVDALSAALGLTLLIDKLDKHGTAVFSGIIPPAIAFLEPEKTFERTTDSLRDFIIALDKEKADHLRYKVEGDVVKIFITPYRTTITGDDLKFSQGDFNVELVIALGVDNQEHLDSALDAQGKILHDATVVTITAGDKPSNLGTIAWHDSKASGLSEMVADLAEPLKAEESLLDKQVATAILTGIVAQTDRFSNPRTTAKTMTTSALLMGAGADPQLVAAKLEESHEIEAQSASEEHKETPLKEGEHTKVKQKDGDLLISHDKKADTPDKKEEPAKVLESDDDGPKIGVVHSTNDSPLVDEEPSMGGTLNATSGQAAEDARNQKENDQNKTLLSHNYLSEPPADPAPLSHDAEKHDDTIVNPLTETPAPTPQGIYSAYAPEPEPEPTPAPTAPEQPVVAPTPAPQPEPATPQPAPTPTTVGLPMPPPLPDFSAPQPAPTPTVEPAIAPAGPAPQPERLGDILAPEAPAAPVDMTPPVTPAPSVDPTPPVTPPSNDPGQFKIPGQ